MDLKYKVGVFAVCIALLSCNGDQPKGTPTQEVSKDSISTSLQLQDAVDYEPLLKKADSLQILYYDDPDGDSLRYSRFYQYTPTADTATVQAFLRSLRRPAQILTAVKPCRSEGKIFVLNGDEALKTVYFSTRCDSCCYLYYIKSGQFYYTALSPEFKQQLNDKKKESKKP